MKYIHVAQKQLQPRFPLVLHCAADESFTGKASYAPEIDYIWQSFNIMFVFLTRMTLAFDLLIDNVMVMKTMCCTVIQQ